MDEFYHLGNKNKIKVHILSSIFKTNLFNKIF